MAAADALGKQWYVEGAAPGQGATVDLFKHRDAENTYELTRLQKGYDAPKGTGRALLDKVHAAADEHGATLIAHLLPDKPRLLDFYQSAGYKVDAESVPPFGGPRIKREPRERLDAIGHQQIVKRPRPSAPQPIDTRTPSGKVLPY